jgi:hypothetical protein
MATWDSVDKLPTPAWFNEARVGIFIMTNGKDSSKADEGEKRTWAFHQMRTAQISRTMDFAP